MKTRKENKSGLLKSVVLSGMIAGAMPFASNADNLFNYEDLGSGSQLRSNLIQKYVSPTNAISNTGENFVFEAKCGEGKCGEGKCGEKKGTEKKQEPKKEGKEKATKGKAKAGESKEKSKSSEAKSGEKSKSSEAKCGEGKCVEKK